MIDWLKKSWWWILILTLVLAGAGYFGWNYRHQQTVKLESLRTFTFTTTDLLDTLDLSGIVDAKRKVSLYYLTGGKLTKLNVGKNDSISAGQVLATIDQADLQKRLERSLNTYLIDRLQFDNLQDNLQDRVPTSSEILHSQTEQILMNNTVLDVEIASIAIKNTNLVSPLAGILVSAPDLIPPMTISPSDRFTIVDDKSLIFRALVDETDLHLLREGQKAILTFDALPDKKTTSVINNIALVSTSGSGGTAFEVEFLLPEFNLTTLRLGMNGDAQIVLQEKIGAAVVPVEAVFERDGQMLVKILTPDGQQVEKVITTGLETDTYYEVLSGLQLGEQVILN